MKSIEMRKFAEKHSGFEWIGTTSGFGTHLPYLLQCLMRTSGAVLEIGCGEFSTPMLHVFSRNRYVLSVDTQGDWIDVLAAKYRSTSHEFCYVESYDHPIVESRFWGVVLVDGPDERRGIEAEKFRDKAEYIVVHDRTADAAFGHKYRRNFSDTVVLSNFHDIEDLEDL